MPGDSEGKSSQQPDSINCSTASGIFDSWRYIVSELISQNRRLDERIVQLEKQCNRRLDELSGQLSKAHGQIAALYIENEALHQQLGELLKYNGQHSHRSQLEKELGGDLWGSRLSTDEDSSATVIGYLTERISSMMGKPSASDTGSTDRHVSGSNISKTEQANHRLSTSAHTETPKETSTLVDLSFQRLTDDGIKGILPALKSNRCCQSLRLNNNSITSAGASLLAGVLADHPTLQHLSLFHNTVGDEGVDSLAKALSTTNTTLAELQLGHNQITDQGVEHLARMIRVNRSLCLLNLQGNKITDRGIRVLAAAIETNSTLETLVLNSNSALTDLTVEFLLDMLRNHGSLKSLSVANCNLSSTGQKRLLKASQCNPSLQVIV